MHEPEHFSYVCRHLSLVFTAEKDLKVKHSGLFRLLPESSVWFSKVHKVNALVFFGSVVLTSNQVRICRFCMSSAVILRGASFEADQQDP